MIPFPILSKFNKEKLDIGQLYPSVSSVAYFKDNRCMVRGAYFYDAPTPQPNWVELKGNGTITRISAGHYLTMLINDTNKTCVVAGSNRSWMNLPNGIFTRLDITSKLNQAGIEVDKIKDIQHSSFASMFILMLNGDLYFWGSNSKNVAGITADIPTFTTPTKVNTGVTSLSYGVAGDAFACCMKGTVAYVSGTVNESGYPNFSSLTKSPWIRAPYLDNNTGYSCAGDHVIYKNSNNDLYYMGRAYYGQAGNGVVGQSLYNTGLGYKIASDIDMFDASEYNTMYTKIGAPQTLYSLGRNGYGQVSTTGTDDVINPPSQYTFPAPLSYLKGNSRYGVFVYKTERNYYTAGLGSTGAFGLPATLAVNQFRTFIPPF